MVQLAAVLLRGVIATFAGLLIAGGTLTVAADRAPVDRPTLVPDTTRPATLAVPDVQGQAYVFAKGILQDNGFAWHVTGPVQGYAANTVLTQRPLPGTTVVDTGAPTVTLTLARNDRYVERGTPENDAPYSGTEIQIPASLPDQPKPRTTVEPRLEPVPVPVAPLAPGAQPVTPATTVAPTTDSNYEPTPTPEPTPAQPPITTTPVTPAPTPATSSGPRQPDFTVPGAPKEPAKGSSLPDRAAELRTWIESHRSPTPTNINHWLYEHAYIVAGAKFGWWHGADALRTLIEVDKRAETLWGVGSQSRTTAEKALAEVLARGG